MLKKIYIYLFLIFLLSFKTNAQEYLNVHYIKTDESYNEYWVTEELTFDELEFENRIELLFSYLFDNGDYIPINISVLNAEVNDGELVLNISDDILRYNGSYTEMRLKAQIIKTALDIPGISNITLLIEGEERPLPEGSIIKNEIECPILVF